MSDNKLIGPWIRRFLMEHLIGERNLARNTQASYRDAMTLLLPFVAKKVGTPIDKLSIEHISSEVVRVFLLHLEHDRGSSVPTRNRRLAAIRALARFIGMRNPEYIAWYAEIRGIHLKKTSTSAMAYLDKPEMDALLDAPDRRSAQGVRDHAILLFLYNTGARADEAAHATVADLDLDRSPSVKITKGKGGKTRLCPLWPSTAGTLASLVADRAHNEAVFLNRCGQPITRFGIYALVKRYVNKASHRMSSLRAKRISPHSIRHTCAMHLLRAGVDINTIRAWLGHVSLASTNLYCEADLEMKAKALAHCEIAAPRPARKHWHDDRKLMTFLKVL